jgi:two-component system, cell cycle sensor histidine kinase and response regulator CckA
MVGSPRPPDSSRPRPEATSGEPLRLILIEDSEDDACLILHELRRGGFAVSAARVETGNELATVLAEGPWDLAIADHNLPQFSAPEALQLVRARAEGLPFIIVSGAMGEDLAVSAMKAGAGDYLVKGQLSRLVPAVRRELADAQQRRQRARAEQALRQAENQLRQAQKLEAVGRLAGGIAHDFNNLLTAIAGYSELALQKLPGNLMARTDIEQIRLAGERAATLTRQLLAFSRQQVLEPRVAHFNTIITNLEPLLRCAAGRQIDFVADLDDRIGHVKVDVGQMERVLMNLVVNARDAMPNGGQLRIATRDHVGADAAVPGGLTIDPGHHLMLTVSDTGVGMTTETAKHIFEPFFTTKGQGRGTGLGLSTVFGIIAQSGGHISVETALGHGTSIEILLPCVSEPLEIEAETPVVMSTRGDETLLLVEDDAAIRDLLHAALESAGYRVLVASDGLDALAVVSAHAGRIDMLITDVSMPRMGGEDLAANLTARYDIPVLLMSGYAEHLVSGPTEGLTPGEAYLQKPFTPSALLCRVRALLDHAPGARVHGRLGDASFASEVA